MDKDKGQASNKPAKSLIKDCQKLLESAEEIIQCPVCMENHEQMEHCDSGHLICINCKGKLETNCCPICKKRYAGSKSFIMSDLTKTLASLKISVDELENDVKIKPIEKVDAYRNLIKTILTKMSIFLSNTGTSFQVLNNYLQNPNYISRKDVEMQMMSLTSQLHHVKYFMDDTKDTLISLKK